jgi:rhodanese-related sulfurtransferase
MNYKNLRPAPFKEAIKQDKDAIILDVRTAAETEAGVIEGAIVIDFLAGDFDKKIKDFDKNKSYYVYCRSGNRSGKACSIMEQLGFAQLANLEGGMLAWNA